MAENKNSLLLKVSLVFCAFVLLVYGSWYCFFPQSLVELSGSEPVDSSWLRLLGATLIALGIGALLISRKPKNQGIFVTTLALGNLFAGLSLLYDWIISEKGSDFWFTAFPPILVLLVSALLWLSRYMARDILNSDQK
jgi:hypothetical protein